VAEDGHSSLVNGSPEGGVSLLAMSKLLAGTDVSYMLLYYAHAASCGGGGEFKRGEAMGAPSYSLIILKKPPFPYKRHTDVMCICDK